MTDDDVCFQLQNAPALVIFCAQMQQSKCYVTAVNSNENSVWVENSPLLHTLLVPTPEGLSCAGFPVTRRDNYPKGKVTKVIKGTYLDVLTFVQQNPNRVTAWSAPTNFTSLKKVFYIKR